MKKLTEGLLIFGFLAVAMLSFNSAFAQDSIVTNQEVETLQIIALSATIIGSLVAVGQGYADSPEGFSVKKLISAIITAVTGSMLLVNLGMVPEQTNGMTILGVFIMYLILGYGADKGLSRLDKNKK